LKYFSSKNYITPEIMQIYLKYDIYNNFKEIKKNNKNIINNEYKKNYSNTYIEDGYLKYSFNKYKYKLYNIIFKHFTYDEIYKYIIKNITVDFFNYMFKNILKSTNYGFPCLDKNRSLGSYKTLLFEKKFKFFINNILNKPHNIRNEIITSYYYNLYYKDLSLFQIQYLLNSIYYRSELKYIEYLINKLLYIQEVRTIRFIWIFLAVSIK
jgi:hypothetical protein